MSIADQLQDHATEELKHALTISRQIDYLGAMPAVQPKPVKVSDNARDMLRFDLENEANTIRNYRERIRQCEAMGEFAIAEHIRDILLDEQDHLIDLATALGEEVPDLTKSSALVANVGRRGAMASQIAFERRPGNFRTRSERLLHGDLNDTRPDRVECSGCAKRHIDNAAANKRSTIINPTLYRTTGVRHGKKRAKR